MKPSVPPGAMARSALFLDHTHTSGYTTTLPSPSSTSILDISRHLSDFIALDPSIPFDPLSDFNQRLSAWQAKREELFAEHSVESYWGPPTLKISQEEFDALVGERPTMGDDYAFDWQRAADALLGTVDPASVEVLVCHGVRLDTTALRTLTAAVERCVNLSGLFVTGRIYLNVASSVVTVHGGLEVTEDMDVQVLDSFLAALSTREHLTTLHLCGGARWVHPATFAHFFQTLSTLPLRTCRLFFSGLTEACFSAPASPASWSLEEFHLGSASDTTLSGWYKRLEDLPRTSLASVANVLDHLDPSTLRRLALTCHALSGVALDQQLKPFTAISHLDLSHNRFSSSALLAIAARIRKTLTGLELVRLRGVCTFDVPSPDSVVALSTALEKCRNLRTLDLALNKLGSGHIKRLAPALRGMPRLTSLDLTWNEVAARGLRHLAKSLGEQDSHRELTELVLSYNGVGDEGMRHLDDMFATTPSIRKLDLSHNGLGDDAASRLASMLKATLRDVHELNLGWNDIGTLGMAKLASAMRHMSELSVLNLHSNKFGPEGAPAVCGALQRLRDASHRTHLQVLELGGNNIGDAGVADILRKVALFPSLSSLGLSENGLGDAATAVLTSVLEHLQKLTDINLFYNNIKDQHVGALLQQLTLLPELYSLNLEHNYVTLHKFVSSLAVDRSSFASLRFLSLAWNLLSQDPNSYSCDKHLWSRFGCLDNLVHLSLDNTWLGSTVFSVLCRVIESRPARALSSLHLGDVSCGTSIGSLEAVFLMLPNLHVVNLGGNYTSTGLDASLEALAKQARAVCDLNISGNMIGHNTAYGSSAPELGSLLNALQRMDSLAALDLENNLLSRVNFKHLANSLVHLQHLRWLNVSINEPDAEGLLELSSTLAGLTHLQYLNLASTIKLKDDEQHVVSALMASLEHLDELVELILASNQLGDAGAVLLAAPLQEHLPRLRILNISFNAIGNDGVRAIAGALLRDDGNTCALTSLNVSCNAFDADGANAIADTLASGSVRALASLNLEQNKIGDGMVRLAAALEDHQVTVPRLSLLSLSSCDIGNHGAELCLRALDSHPRISGLYLQNNDIVELPSDSALAICSGSLLTLDLRDNQQLLSPPASVAHNAVFFYRDLARGGSTLRNMNVLVVGPGCAGKTTMKRRVFLEEDSLSTDVASWETTQVRLWLQQRNVLLPSTIDSICADGSVSGKLLIGPWRDLLTRAEALLDQYSGSDSTTMQLELGLLRKEVGQLQRDMLRCAAAGSQWLYASTIGIEQSVFTVAAPSDWDAKLQRQLNLSAGDIKVRILDFAGQLDYWDSNALLLSNSYPVVVVVCPLALHPASNTYAYGAVSASEEGSVSYASNDVMQSFRFWFSFLRTPATGSRRVPTVAAMTFTDVAQELGIDIPAAEDVRAELSAEFQSTFDVQEVIPLTYSSESSKSSLRSATEKALKAFARSVLVPISYVAAEDAILKYRRKMAKDALPLINLDRLSRVIRASHEQFNDETVGPGLLSRVLEHLQGVGLIFTHDDLDVAILEPVDWLSFIFSRFLGDHGMQSIFRSQAGLCWLTELEDKHLMLKCSDPKQIHNVIRILETLEFCLQVDLHKHGDSSGEHIADHEARLVGVLDKRKALLGAAPSSVTVPHRVRDDGNPVYLFPCLLANCSSTLMSELWRRRLGGVDKARMWHLLGRRLALDDRHVGYRFPAGFFATIIFRLAKAEQASYPALPQFTEHFPPEEYRLFELDVDKYSDVLLLTAKVKVNIETEYTDEFFDDLERRERLLQSRREQEASEYRQHLEQEGKDEAEIAELVRLHEEAAKSRPALDAVLSSTIEQESVVRTEMVTAHALIRFVHGESDADTCVEFICAGENETAAHTLIRALDTFVVPLLQRRYAALPLAWSALCPACVLAYPDSCPRPGDNPVGTLSNGLKTQTPKTESKMSSIKSKLKKKLKKRKKAKKKKKKKPPVMWSCSCHNAMCHASHDDHRTMLKSEFVKGRKPDDSEQEFRLIRRATETSAAVLSGAASLLPSSLHLVRESDEDDEQDEDVDKDAVELASLKPVAEVLEERASTKPVFSARIVSHTESIACLALSSSGDVPVLASGAADRTVRLWRAETLDQHTLRGTDTPLVVPSLTGHVDTVSSLVWSTDCTMLASASSGDRGVCVWSAHGRRLAVLFHHRAPVNALAFVPAHLTGRNSNLLVSGSQDSSVCVWKLPTLDPQLGAYDTTKFPSHPWLTWEHHTDRVTDVSIGPFAYPNGGVEVVTASRDATVLLHTLYPHQPSADSAELPAVFSHNDLGSMAPHSDVPGYVAEGGLVHARTQSIDDVTSEYQSAESLKKAYVTSQVVFYTPPSNTRESMIAYGDGLGTVWVRWWEHPKRTVGHRVSTKTKARTKTAVLRRDRAAITSVLFLEPGDLERLGVSEPLVVSGASDGSVRVWLARSGTQLHMLSLHSSAATAMSVVFVPQLAVQGNRVSKRRLVAVASEDGTVSVWDPLSGELGFLLRGHLGAVTAMQATQDGRLITGSVDNTIRAWELSYGGELQYTLALEEAHRQQTIEHQQRFNSVNALTDVGNDVEVGEGIGHDSVATMSPDGAWFAAATPFHDDLVLWHSGTGRRLRLDKSDQQDVFWSESDNDDEAKRDEDDDDDDEDEDEPRDKPEANGMAASEVEVAVAEEPVELAASSVGDPSSRGDLVDDAEDLVRNTSAKHTVQCLKFDKRTNLLAAGSLSGSVSIWSLSSTGESFVHACDCTTAQRHPRPVTTLAFAPAYQRQQLVNAIEEARVRELEAAGDDAPVEKKKKQQNGIVPKQKVVLVSCDESGLVQLWHVVPRRRVPGVYKLRRYESLHPFGGSSRIRHVVFSPQVAGRMVLLAGDGAVEVRDVSLFTSAQRAPLEAAGGEEDTLLDEAVKKRVAGSGQSAPRLELSPSGEWMAVTTLRHSVALFTMKPRSSTVRDTSSDDDDGYESDTEEAAIAQRLAQIRRDQQRQLEQQRALSEHDADILLVGHRMEISDLAFARNGAFLVTVSLDKTARLWRLNLRAGQREASGDVVMFHSRELSAVAVSPSGNYIATGSADNVVRVWDTEGNLQRLLYGHTARISWLRFLPDSLHLTSSSRDGFMKVWDLRRCPSFTEVQARLTGMDAVVLHRGGEGVREAQRVLADHPDVVSRRATAADALESKAKSGEVLVEWGDTLLHWAMRGNQPGVLHMLLQSPHADPLASSWSQSGKSGSPLLMAVSRRQDACVQLILDALVAGLTSSNADSAMDAYSMVTRAAAQALQSGSKHGGSAQQQGEIGSLGHMGKFNASDGLYGGAPQWLKSSSEGMNDVLPLLAAYYPLELTRFLQQLDAVPLPLPEDAEHAMRDVTNVKGMARSEVFRSGSQSLTPTRLWARFFRVLEEKRSLSALHSLYSVVGAARSYEVHSGDTSDGVDVKPSVVPIAELAGSRVAAQPMPQHPIGCLVVQNLPDALGTPLVRHVLGFKWARYARNELVRQLLGYFVFLAAFSLASLLPECYSLDGVSGFARAALDVFVEACAAVFAYNEYQQWSRAGSRHWGNGWNWLDAMSLVLVFSLIPFRLWCWDASNSVQAVAAVCLWLKTLDYARAFRRTGPFVRMILRIARAIFFFLAILTVLLLAFSHGFYLLFRGQDLGADVDEPGSVTDYTSWWVLVKLYQVVLSGEFDRAELTFAGSEWLALSFMIVFTFFVTILMLNLLIALMGHVYDEVQANVENEWLLERAQIILDVDRAMIAKHGDDKTRFPRWVHCLSAAEPLSELQPNELAAFADDTKRQLQEAKTAVGDMRGELKETKQRLSSDLVAVKQQLAAVVEMLEAQQRAARARA